MNLENTATKTITVLADVFGTESKFNFPQPFTPEDFTDLASRLNISADGFAKSSNQTLLENLRNNFSSRVNAAVKKRKTDPSVELPTQDDLDTLAAEYDFVRYSASTGSTVSKTPFEKALAMYARTQVRAILKANGYPRDGIPAPATVAKAGAEPTQGQISYETFKDEVESLVSGEGVWSENKAFADFRQQFVIAPAAAKIAADETATTDVAARLGLSQSAVDDSDDDSDDSDD
jgi:hypothetical protein